MSVRRFDARSRTGILRAALGAVALALSAAGAQSPPQAPPAVPAPSPRAPRTESPPPPPASPAAADRLGWNARERTAAGIRAFDQGDAESAREALDTALRLRPADPLARYNAGTGRLATGDPSAGPLLDLAAREAPPELAPSAWYNLGDARLGAQDWQGAASAFVETLKRDPDHADAKHNLELALREIEKQRQQQQQPQSGGEDQEQNQNQQSNDPQQNDQQGDQQQQRQNQQQGGDDPSQQDPSGGNDPKNQKKPGQGPLPQFKDLPDMTADQAAAILRAVENLERQQRRERAEKAAKAASAAVEVDW